MWRKTLCYWFIAIVFISSLGAQEFSIQDQKTFGGNDDDFGHHAGQLYNQTYVVAGGSFSSSTGNKTAPNRGGQDGWVIHLNTSLQEIWQQSYGGNDNDLFNTVFQAKDGNLLCGGSSSSPVSGNKTAPNRGNSDMWVLKLDTAGNILWQQTYGGADNDYLSDIDQFNDSSLLLAGRSSSGATGNKTDTSRGSGDYWIVKTSPDGNIIWDQAFGGKDFDDPIETTITENNNIIVVGNSSSDSSGEKSHDNYSTDSWKNDIWVLKLNSSGSLLWEKTLGGNQSDGAEDVIQFNGHIYIVGSSDSDSSGTKTTGNEGNDDYWILKLTTQGDIIWDKTLGGAKFDYATSILSRQNGNLLINGTSYSGKSGNKTVDSIGGGDWWFVSIDTSNGDTMWQKTIGGNKREFLQNTIYVSDTGFLCIGDSKSGISGDKDEINRGKNDYWMVHLTGPVINSVKRPENQRSISFKVFPNPSSGIIYLQTSKPLRAPVSLRLYTMGGSLIYTARLNAYMKQWAIRTSGLSSGTYFLELNTRHQRITKKLVVTNH